MKKAILFFIFSLFIGQYIYAQCSTQDYQSRLLKANDSIAVGNFVMAKNILVTAKYFACNLAEEKAIDDKINALFLQIDSLRKRETEATNVAKAEKNKADSLFNIAEMQRLKVQSVLDKIYFYDNKFGLAYNEGNSYYGFIDKDLNEKINYKYAEALPFNKTTGYARVKSYDDNIGDDIYYLIDTFDTKYPMVTNHVLLTPLITAVDLTNQKITTIPKVIFKNTQLEVFVLEDNRLTSLPSQIKYLKNLKSIHLSGNKLTFLPKEIGSLTKLEVLDLYQNKLTSLPWEIGLLQNLQVLDLSWDLLIQLPRNIGRLKKLKHLGLTGNSLNSLPKEIGQLDNLELLDLYGNSIDSLPSQISGLKNLITLNLGNNKLDSLPREIGLLKKLNSLDIRENRLEKLPEEIGQLKNLKQLDISNSRFKQLPNSIMQLEKLESLRLTFIY